MGGGTHLTATLYALAVVVVSAAIIHLTKLPTFKDPGTGALRNFGTGAGETVFPAWMAMMLAGYFTYLVAV